MHTMLGGLRNRRHGSVPIEVAMGWMVHLCFHKSICSHLGCSLSCIKMGFWIVRETGVMWDLDTVKRWGAQALFPASIDRWMWCRKELPPLVVHSAIGAGAAPTVQVDMQALANAFWPWVSGLERDRRFQSLDSLDFAHFAAGQLLCQLLRAQPLQLPTGQHHEAVFALSRTVVTLLAAWRQALGATPWAMQLPERHSAPWASYLENVAEDPQWD